MASTTLPSNTGADTSNIAAVINAKMSSVNQPHWLLDSIRNRRNGLILSPPEMLKFVDTRLMMKRVLRGYHSRLLDRN